MEPAQERRQDVALFEVEVVVRPVEIRRHRADEVEAVLAAVVGAELQSGDLGERVAFVRRLQRASEQRVFSERLRRVLRVNTRAAEEEEFRYAELGGGLDDVVLDAEIIEEELDLKRGVGLDAADPCRCEDDVRGPLLTEEGAHGDGVLQLQFCVRAGEDAPARQPRIVPQQRAACEATVPGDEDCFVRHCECQSGGGHQKVRVLLSPVPGQVKRIGTRRAREIALRISGPALNFTACAR